MDVFTILQLALVFFVAVFIILFWYTNKNHNHWQKLGIPCEKPLPFIGNLHFALRTSVFDYFKGLKDRKDDYFGMYLGTTPALVVQTPELAKRIMVKDFDNFPDRFNEAAHQDRLGNLNLFTLKSPLWQKMRQELTPMFTTAKLKSLLVYMNRNSTCFVDRIRRDHVDDNKPVNLKETGTMFASDTVAFNVFGLRVSALTDGDSPLWAITNHMVNWNFRRGLEITSIFLLPTLAKLLRFEFFSKTASEYIKDLFRAVVKTRNNSSTATDKDLVNHLLKIEEKLKISTENNPELAEDLMMAQVAVFILGSVETSANTLAFCMHELAYHQDEQEKLYNEVKEAFVKSGKESLDYEELVECRYLTQCLYETMRKYPLLAYLDRVSNEDYKLDDKLTIKKGTPVLVNVMALHYNEQYFPEPNEWRPERITAISDSDNQNYTFFPFGDGPRFCIGKRYGMLQIRAALAHIIKNFRILPVPGVSYDMKIDPYSVITAPKSGGVVQFVSR